MPFEIELDNLPAGYAVSAARPGEEVAVQTIEFVSTEDGDEFISRLEGLPPEIFNKIPSVSPSMINRMLVVLRADKTATVYINEDLKVMSLVQAKKDVNKGEPVFQNDIADIKSIQFEGVEIPQDCAVIYIFSFGWRKGLFYDFSPIQYGKQPKRDYDIEKQLGQCYLYLMFQDRFKISDGAWDELFSQGWFPFIALTGETLTQLNNYAKQKWDINENLPAVSAEVRSGLPKWFVKWKRLDQLLDHVDLLERAIERFLAKDFISAVSILYPRIEGVMRSHHFSVLSSSTKGTQRGLIDSSMSSVDPEQNPKHLLLPVKFQSYLEDIYFANFDPVSPGRISRNTVSHGVASKNDFSEKSACIGFLIIEQLTYYYAGNDEGVNL
jgi:hypothetical protein